MITIRYCAKGKAVSDFAVEEWWARVLATEKAGRSMQYNVSTEPPIARARAAVCKRDLLPEDVVFIFGKLEQHPDYDGRLAQWPDGFCDTLTKILEALLEPVRCPACGSPEFWYEPWQLYICSSWKGMEGGCDPRGDIRGRPRPE